MGQWLTFPEGVSIRHCLEPARRRPIGVYSPNHPFRPCGWLLSNSVAMAADAVGRRERLPALARGAR